MNFYVYVIQSTIDGTYYKGFTEEPGLRLKRHNQGDSKYTRTKMPWQLVYLELQPSKKDGLIREKILKKYSHDQIRQLIRSPKNCLTKYMEEHGG